MGIEFLELHPLVKVCAECDYALCRFQMVKVED